MTFSAINNNYLFVGKKLIFWRSKVRIFVPMVKHTLARNAIRNVKNSSNSRNLVIETELSGGRLISFLNTYNMIV